MRLFGGALVGLVNLGAGQPAAQRQAEHLPMAVRQRERRRRVAAFAEARSVAGVQDVAQRAHALPGKLLGTDVGILKRGAAQAGERQRGAPPQLRVLAGACDVGSEPLRRAKIGIRGRPQPVGFEFPFQELPVHQSPAGFNIATHGSSFAFPLRLFSTGFAIYSRKPDNTRNPMPLLQDHIAVVTGAGSGIGRAIALGYAREGAQVALLDLNEAAAAEAVIKDWEDVIAINLTGVFNVTHAFLETLRAGKGRIVNIGSIQSFVHVRQPSSPAYTASKHGVLGFTRALAAELGKDGVRVNAIGPGFIETPLNEKVRASNPELAKIFVDHT